MRRPESWTLFSTVVRSRTLAWWDTLLYFDILPQKLTHRPVSGGTFILSLVLNCVIRKIVIFSPSRVPKHLRTVVPGRLHFMSTVSKMFEVQTSGLEFCTQAIMTKNRVTGSFENHFCFLPSTVCQDNKIHTNTLESNVYIWQTRCIESDWIILSCTEGFIVKSFFPELYHSPCVWIHTELSPQGATRIPTDFARQRLWSFTYKLPQILLERLLS